MKGAFYFCQDCGTNQPVDRKHNCDTAAMTDPTQARAEAIAEWLYDFDSDGKPHRMSWKDFFSLNPGTGFLLSAKALIEVDPATRQLAELQAVAQQMREALRSFQRGGKGWVGQCHDATAAYDSLTQPPSDSAAGEA